MDPDKTWRDLIEAIAKEEYAIAAEIARDLLGWIKKGGFPPVNRKHDSLISHSLEDLRRVDRFIVIGTCREVISHRRAMRKVTR